nr:Chain A, Beta-defensin 7
NSKRACYREGGECLQRCIGLFHKIGTCNFRFKCCKFQ